LTAFKNNVASQLIKGTIQMSQLIKNITKVVVPGLAVMALALAATASVNAATINLVPSWNLLGNSDSAAVNVATAFGNSANVSTVWKWIPASSKWAFYTPLQTDGGAAYAATKGYDFLTTINGGEGYWINAKLAFTAQLTAGTALTAINFQDNLNPPNPLPAGWSLIAVGGNPTPVGFNNSIGVTPPAQGAIANNLTTLWAWDSALSSWYFYAPSLDSAGTLTTYITSKNYRSFGSNVLTPTTGFWVNRPASAGASAPISPVLTGIQTTMTALGNLFFTSIPAATNPALVALFDPTLLDNGQDRASFLQMLTSPGKGPGVGVQLVNLALVAPRDAGAAANDATHQWFTFGVTSGGAPDTAWLAIKNSAGNWLIAGNQRQFAVYLQSQAVKHIPSAAGATMTYESQVTFQTDSAGNYTGVSQILVSGPGLVGANGGTDIPMYASNQGSIWIPSCGTQGMSGTISFNCMDVTQATVGAQYNFKIYAATGGATVPTYTYTNVLLKAPLSQASLATAAYPAIHTVTSDTGAWAPGDTVTVNWTFPTGTQPNWISVGAWSATNSQLFQVSQGIAGGAAAIVVPSFTGTIAGKNIFLSGFDASGNVIAVDYQIDPAAVTPITPIISTPVVNLAALAGIQTTMTAFQNLFATAIPAATDPALSALFDPTLLDNGQNKTALLQQIVTPGNGLNIGDKIVNIALAAPLDSGAAPNDATHQWFTFDVTPGGGPGNAWLAIKDAATGSWLGAGNQRQFDSSVNAQAVKIIPSSAQAGVPITYQNQVSFNVGGNMSGVTQILVAGPGLSPSTGVLLYTPGTGQIWIAPCGSNGPAGTPLTTGCMDAAQATAGAQYSFHVYTATGGANAPTYTYANVLAKSPLPLASLNAALFPSINTVSGNWASGSTVTVNWTLPLGMQASWLSIGGWSMTGATLFQVGNGVVANSTSETIMLPAYTGVLARKNVWLQIFDANGNQLAVNQQY